MHAGPVYNTGPACMNINSMFIPRNLQDAENQLAALSTGLTTVDERVASLKEQLGKHTRDAATIELRLSNAAKTIDTARGLLEQLAQEYSAWETDVSRLVSLKML